MKIKLSLAALLAFAVVTVACAAPTEDPTAEQQPASEEDGKTAQQKEDLMKGGLGAGCDITCSSADGFQTCCCSGTNIKCVSLSTTCQCQDATRFSGGGTVFLQRQ